MAKRAFLIHGWGGSPQEGWLPWLKKELEQRDFKVIVPEMPNTEEPKIEEWVPFLESLVDNPDENTYFVGHSIGCQTILRYLETLPENSKIGGAVFVAGWLDLKNLTEGEKEIAKPWIENKINLGKVKNKAENFVAIFSDNDPYETTESSEIFRKELGAEIIVEHNKKHFSGSDGVTELPSALNAVLKIS